MIGLQAELPYCIHLMYGAMLGGTFLQTVIKVYRRQMENSKFREKNGSHAIEKNPITTATVVAIRRSWRKGGYVH